jgi:hypothetical protein
MAQQIWPPRSAVLLPKATWAFSREILYLQLLPAPFLRCLCTASPARGGPVWPGVLEKKTRGGGFQEIPGRKGEWSPDSLLRFPVFQSENFRYGRRSNTYMSSFFFLE